MQDAPYSPPAPPTWVVPSLWHALIATRDAALASGASEATAHEAARRSASTWPALSAGQMDEALAALRGTRPSSLHLETLELSPAPRETPRVAPREAVVSALSRALRDARRNRPLLGQRGASRRSAEWIADQLAHSNFVVVSGPASGNQPAG